MRPIPERVYMSLWHTGLVALGLYEYRRTQPNEARQGPGARYDSVPRGRGHRGRTGYAMSDPPYLGETKGVDNARQLWYNR
jgi:hypothetical protein